MSLSLTRDQMRADLARALRLPPEEIGDDDDLVDLGLDSMRAMTLLARWSERGLALELSAVAEAVTLGAWWALAERALAVRADG
jgi:aryl carrier-like protein